MRNELHLKFLILLVVLGAPLLANAQSSLRFSVVPGDESGLIGVGTTNTDFRFSVNAAGALCYQIDFGDGNRTASSPPSSTGMALHPHSFARPGRYVATMRAWWPDADVDFESVDCSADLSALPAPIELRLQIVVRPPSAIPQPARPTAIFSVALSGPATAADGPSDADARDFTFTAFVTGARRYQINYGDGVVEAELSPQSVGDGVIRRHQYEDPGSYLAVLTARSGSGELVELVRQVTVQEPVSIVPVQWPTTRAAPTLPEKGDRSDFLAWLLLLAAIIASLRFGGSSPVPADPLTFEATRDRGRSTVTGGKAASDAVSVRLRTKQPEFEISKEAATLDAQSRPNPK
ncbi:MAG: hypothetical protein HKN35_07070 [Woeseia sp.]|nr:PKD domain-containing protein [Woeseia sp.]MBT8096179.1 PKD domain-containing protein [Woeseia sp.]NNE60636.1 hypothetical protein [Woeseia sp.]